ncbi:hypothetical protein [Halpernia frigidisoli]|nr:hypothetical protein [Halpernia frigidisoli]
MKEEQPTYYINSRHRIFDLELKEVWRYQDLLGLLVKRDFITFYF